MKFILFLAALTYHGSASAVAPAKFVSKMGRMPVHKPSVVAPLEKSKLIPDQLFTEGGEGGNGGGEGGNGEGGGPFNPLKLGEPRQSPEEKFKKTETFNNQGMFLNVNPELKTSYPQYVTSIEGNPAVDTLSGLLVANHCSSENSANVCVVTCDRDSSDKIVCNIHKLEK